MRDARILRFCGDTRRGHPRAICYQKRTSRGGCPRVFISLSPPCRIYPRGRSISRASRESYLVTKQRKPVVIPRVLPLARDNRRAIARRLTTGPINHRLARRETRRDARNAKGTRARASNARRFTVIKRFATPATKFSLVSRFEIRVAERATFAAMCHLSITREREREQCCVLISALLIHPIYISLLIELKYKIPFLYE
jgi:hypothetical protein